MSINNINKKIFYLILLIFFIEIVSFTGYFFPIISGLAFTIIIIITLIISLWRLEYGLLILLAELFIGSKGYLFYLDYGGGSVSLRIGLWVIIISVWLGKTIIYWIKNKRLEIDFLKSNYLYYYLLLFVFIGWGLINGWLNHNELNNIFFDFNGWLYFALILPIYSVIKEEKNINNLLQIFIAAGSWLIIKTIFLLYIFSHNVPGLVYDLYRWLRLTGAGEITQVQGGFYRIFMQSHIYVLIGFFIILLYITNIIINNKWQFNKKFIYSFTPLVLSLVVVLISFSRSFWFALAAGLIILWLIWLIYFKINWHKFIGLNLIILSAAVCSFAIIIIIVKFPFPNPLGGFNVANLYENRASNLSTEAGAASRWSLAPSLWSAIESSPILGTGFGTTVTYKTSDPKIININPSGQYTTYAFEWGWLDIWLKIGLVGLLLYLTLITKIILKIFSRYLPLNLNEYWLVFGAALGVILITLVSIFSPYTNHPLGIGYLMLSTAVIDYCFRRKPPLA